MKLLAREKILPHNSVLSYQIELYFPKHKLATEVYEKGHTNRDKEK